MFSFVNKVGREEMFSFPNVGKSSFINKVGSREEMFSFPSASRASSTR